MISDHKRKTEKIIRIQKRYEEKRRLLQQEYDARLLNFRRETKQQINDYNRIQLEIEESKRNLQKIEERKKLIMEKNLRVDIVQLYKDKMEVL